MKHAVAANDSGAGQVTNTGFRPEVRGFESLRLHTLRLVADGQRRPAETTHEAFVHAVRAAAVARLADAASRDRLMAAKLVYGGGPAGVRGLCYFGAWENGAQHDFLEITANGEESYVQLAGTTVHELGHCLAGSTAGHGPAWKAACALLGLHAAQAAGQAYAPEHFQADLWAAIESLPHPSDGRPQFRGGHGAAPTVARRAKPCPLGIGTRGGRSRGVGSGSRLRLWVCGCPEGTVGRKVRVASDDWDATCNRCGTRYAKPEAGR